jgi:hypothetical protein
VGAGAGAGGGEAGRPRLKHYTVTADKGQWHLHVWLQAPVAGQVQLTLRLLPRQPATPGPVRLRLPLPLGATLAGGIMGYRVDHPNPTDNRVNFQGLFLKPDKFKEQWPAPPGVLPTRAYTFVNHAPGSTVEVGLPPIRPVVEQELLWTVRLDRADLVATLKATATGDELVVLDWEVPVGVTVSEITGDNVRGWSRAGPNESRVQVWLKQPARAAVLQLRGWAAYPRVPSAAARTWLVPVLRPADAGRVQTTLRVGAAPAVETQAETKKFLNLAAVPPTADAWTTTNVQGFYRAEFLLRATAPAPAVQGLTSVELRDGLVQLTTFLHVNVVHSGPAAFTVGVAGWQGPPLKLDAPGGVAVSYRPGRRGGQQWHVAVPAAAPRRLVLKLAVSLPATAGLRFDLPRLDLSGADWSEHWVAASTPGLHVRAATGLTAVKDGRGLPEVVVEHFGRPAALWKAARPDWRLGLDVVTPSAAPGLQLLYAEQRAVFADGFGWIHQAQLLLYVKESYDVTMQMPPGALLVDAAIDGEVGTPRFVGPDRIALTISGGEGAHHLGLRWVFGRQNEDVAQPNLQTPLLEGMSATPVSWTVTLPAGYRWQDPATAPETWPALARARQHAGRAGALATVFELLAERWNRTAADGMRLQLLAVEKQFVRQCRLAVQWLEAPAGPEDAAAQAQVRQEVAALLERNAAVCKREGSDKLRAQAEKSASVADKEPEVFTLPVRGKVVRWQTAAGDAPPAVALAAVEPLPTGLPGDEADRAWAETRTVLVLFGVLLGLTWVPGLMAALRRMWPEQVAALAVVGWCFGGFSLVAAALLVVAAVGRMRLVLAWVRRPRVVPAEPQTA